LLVIVIGLIVCNCNLIVIGKNVIDAYLVDSYSALCLLTFEVSQLIHWTSVFV